MNFRKNADAMGVLLASSKAITPAKHGPDWAEEQAAIAEAFRDLDTTFLEAEEVKVQHGRKRKRAESRWDEEEKTIAKAFAGMNVDPPSLGQVILGQPHAPLTKCTPDTKLMERQWQDRKTAAGKSATQQALVQSKQWNAAQVKAHSIVTDEERFVIAQIVACHERILAMVNQPKMHKTRLIFDTREASMYSYFRHLEPAQLVKRQDIAPGDIHMECDGKICSIMERKTWFDLSASFSDGRRKEQLKRLLSCSVPRHFISYVLEQQPEWFAGPKEYSDYTHVKPFSSLASSMSKLRQLFGINIIHTTSLLDTVWIISKDMEMRIKEGLGTVTAAQNADEPAEPAPLLGAEDLPSSIQIRRRDLKTPELRFAGMFQVIDRAGLPRVRMCFLVSDMSMPKQGQAIAAEYKTMGALCQAYQKLLKTKGESACEKMLEKLKYQTKAKMSNFGKLASRRVYHLLMNGRDHEPPKKKARVTPAAPPPSGKFRRKSFV